MTIETPRLQIFFVERLSEDLDPTELLPIINSNPDFVEQSEGVRGKCAYSIEEIEKVRRESWREHLRVFALRLKGNQRLVGYGDLLAPHPNRPWAAIGLLVIHKDFQSFGLGREAVDALHSMLAREGWSEVEVAVFHERQRSRLFWENCGYHFTRDAIAENGHNVWVLRKCLALKLRP